MSAPTSRRNEALWLASTALLGWVGVLAVFAPGFMSRDSGLQLAQARSLQFSDAHPVIMALLWHPLDRLWPGPGGLFALVDGVYWAGLAVVCWAVSGRLAYRIAALLALGLCPPVAINFPMACKDALMQGALVASVGCCVLGMASWRKGRALSGWPWWLSAITLAVVAIGARHNAAAGVWALIAWPLCSVPFLKRLAPGWRLLASSGLGMVATLLMVTALSKALAPITRAEKFWQSVPTFDLAAMSLDVGKVLVEPDSQVLTAGMGLPQIRRLFHPYYSNSLYYCLPFRGQRCVPLFQRTVDDRRLKLLANNWKQAVVEHPGAYLRHRLRLGLALLAIQAGPTEAYFVDGMPHHPLAAHYPVPDRAVRAIRWLDKHLRDWWMRPWLYALLGCALWPFALYRFLKRQGPVLPVLFPLSGMAYLASVVVGAGSPDYRYTVWMTLCTWLSALTLVRPLRVES